MHLVLSVKHQPGHTTSVSIMTRREKPLKQGPIKAHLSG
jgi:hypothetical protein